MEEHASGKEPLLQGLPGLVLSTKEGGVKETQKEASKKVPSPKGTEVRASKIGALMIEAERDTTKNVPIVKEFEGSSTKTGTTEGDGAKKGTTERKQEDDNVYNIDTYTGSIPSLS